MEGLSPNDAHMLLIKLPFAVQYFVEAYVNCLVETTAGLYAGIYRTVAVLSIIIEMQYTEKKNKSKLSTEISKYHNKIENIAIFSEWNA